ncbi:PaaX family transcriptional regulator C-terminal domain-containing protein [Yinghuangia sp. YIM S09857]|uniref:PaaX family transcriptional regulator C-terminal domain-containing protein n=1 Tax=Yinghuangia sp. YIM S09857 TaxID=3436929 RepID=UPI003F53207F
MGSGERIERQMTEIRARGHRPAVILGLLSMYTGPGELVPSAGLVKAVRALGLSESSTRTALSRLQADGSLVRHRDGRHTSYRLAAPVRKVLDGERERMLATEAPAVGRPLSLVAFTVPEANRDLRHELRTALAGAGYVSVFDGLWAATADRAERASKVLAELDVPSICLFRAEVDPLSETPPGFASPELARYRSRLAQFLDLYAPLCGSRLDDEQAYTARSGLSRDWFALIDPHPALPPALLADWPIDAVRDATNTVWRQTEAAGRRHFASLIADD